MQDNWQAAWMPTRRRVSWWRFLGYNFLSYRLLLLDHLSSYELLTSHPFAHRLERACTALV